jgi:acyl-CoA thioesterase-2
VADGRVADGRQRRRRAVPSPDAGIETVTAEGAPGGATTLLELLTLEQLDVNLFRAPHSAVWPLPALFGGQVAAQALRAAASTVGDDRTPHSLHGYFLRPGRSDARTLLHVDRDRDGRSYTSRHVNAVQQGEVIFSALASFHVAEQGPEHQSLDLPAAMEPPADDAEVPVVPHSFLEVVAASGSPLPEQGGTTFWARVVGELPVDPVTSACVLTYLSDFGWAFGALDATQGYHGPSLDHAVWLVRPIDTGDWMFVDMVPVTASAARGVFTGTIHDRHGTLAAYITQEAVLRKHG